MAVYALGDRVPEIDESAYVSPEATIIGSVVIGPRSTIWPHAVLRADDNYIRVGEGSSIQDGAVVHVTGELETVVGDFCTVGHLAHLEGCTVRDHSLIGSGSVVLHEAVIGPHALVGGAAMVPGGVEVPPHAMALGVPARILADRLPDHHSREGADSYIERGERFRNELRRLD